LATFSNTTRPGYVWDSTDNVWYPIGVGGHSHGEIPATIADAKGDLIAGTAADTVSRLAVGTNGQYLKADSTAGTGLAWATLPSSGKVLQVITAQYSTGTTISTTTFTDTGLTATITPTLNTSKILVLISQYGEAERAAYRCWGGWQYLRGATVLASRVIAFGINVVSGTSSASAGFLTACYLDSPATTSATTYKTQAAPYESTSSGLVTLNTFPSSITLMGIGA